MIKIPKLNKLKTEITIDIYISLFESDYFYLLPSLKIQTYNSKKGRSLEIGIEWLLFNTYIDIGKFREY